MEKLTLEKTRELHVILWDDIARQIKTYRNTSYKIPNIMILKKIAFQLDERLQPYQNCKSGCFACEYADDKCSKCPLEWGNGDGGCKCISEGSVYCMLNRSLDLNHINYAIALAEKIRDMPWKTEEEEKLYFRIHTTSIRYTDPVELELRGFLLEERNEKIFKNIFGRSYREILPNAEFAPGTFYTFLSVCAGFTNTDVMSSPDESILIDASIDLYNRLICIY